MIECKKRSSTVASVSKEYPQPLTDIQELPDTRGIAIQRVGIQDLQYPIIITNQQGLKQASVGLFNLSISLPAVQKGAHLSRFIEVIEKHQRAFSTEGDGLDDLLHLIQSTLHADKAFLEISFPFFIEKLAPITQLKSIMNYDVRFKVEKSGDSPMQQEVIVSVPVTSVCPCSKAISLYGAHNQRSLLTLSLKTKYPVSFEYWISLIEKQGSAELFALLKRPDEKWVTENAYQNAKFVEDIVRDIALKLNQDENVMHYHIASKNLESIHNHAAYAEIWHSNA
jgi:GTP cyclohydrolase FolE2